MSVPVSYTLLLAVVAAGTLAVAGCGESKGADRLSKEDYLKRADAVCAAFDHRLDELPEPKTIEEVVTLADESKPIAERGLAELRKLRPPTDLQEDVDAWLALNQANVDAIDDLRKAAAASDEAAARAVSEARGRERAEGRRAREADRPRGVRRSRLGPREARVALLEERGDALAEVVRRRGGGLELRLQLELLLEP